MLKRVPLLVLMAMVLCTACDKDKPTKPSLPTSGNGLLFASSRDIPAWEVYSMRPDGSGVARLTNDSLFDSQPRWSPDGKRIAFLRRYVAQTYPFDRHQLAVMNWDGTDPVRLTDDLGDDSPSWSPDGTRISFVRTTSTYPELWTVNADGTSPTLVADTLNVFEISWTSQNTFLGVDGFGIVRFNADGTGQSRILSLNLGTVHEVYPRMSPDGARIVFHWYGPSGSDSQIYVVNSDGANLQKLTNTSGIKWYPIWSPDGSKIAFSWGASAYLAIVTMNPDGSGQAQVSPGPGDEYIGDWR
ncbi:MAG TPA: LpqB family beta-propeller domain-containing protein [Acidobacteriota bacterium]|nr:LpqB family beta-propeller domain-containing protein [Acidobacteriota bacterium]